MRRPLKGCGSDTLGSPLPAWDYLEFASGDRLAWPRRSVVPPKKVRAPDLVRRPYGAGMFREIGTTLQEQTLGVALALWNRRRSICPPRRC